ncbi:MAG: methyltransferase family protein [Beijerinckiaceae bacterium]
MVALGGEGRPNTITRWLSSTPRRTFILYPVLIFLVEAFVHGDRMAFTPSGLLLMAWGYGQYRLSGLYRTRMGGGGPGIDKPPHTLVQSGVYAWIRNPMYLGHLIFMTGLIVLFSSWAAAALLAFHLWWFQQRVLEDEKHMRELFGTKFDDYASRVRRWGLF